MKYVALCFASMACGGAHAATYVYQANAYQQHGGRCGAQLLPFQATIKLFQPLEPNSKSSARVRMISVTAGGTYQWTKKFSKMEDNEQSFTTDANGLITGWAVSGGKGSRNYFYTDNGSDRVEDDIVFRCGAADVVNNPGAWTRTD